MKKDYNFFSLVFSFIFLLGSISVYSQFPSEFVKVDLVTNLANATNFKFSPDGRIFIIDRYGELLIYKPDTQVTVSAGTVPVFHQFEEGLLGIAFDPNFSMNNYVYLHYAVISPEVNRVSRFFMNGDVLDLASETVVLEWGTQRIKSYHSGGDMDFDSQGNLYIAVGDNTFYDNPYGAHNETDITATAEKSSSNANDMRGKILRITPLANGTYTIPAGNLFPGGTGGLPEIYVMGARNPYRIFVDKQNTDWLFWGEVGPDANSQTTQGPEGLDEMNLTKSAQNAGWPYFSGVDNDAYQVDYRTPSPYYNNPASPQNTSTWNTGATNLPPAEPAWLEFFHKCYLAGPRYYYDGAQTDQQRLPIEFDEVFFYYDFNSSKVWGIEMDANGNITNNEQLSPSVFPVGSDGFIDMKIGPDGHMYILAYGSGCCPNNTGTGRLIRIDYTGITTNSPPVVVLTADPTNGALPLTVNFSGAGTTDPNGDTPLSYAWDFTTDGTVDATTQDTSFTYTVAGTYNAQLKVDDGNGGIGVKNVTIYAGNTLAVFDFTSPPDGGLFDWDDDMSFSLNVTDAEEGNVDCNDVDLVPSLGHLNHFHDDLTLSACPQTITLASEAGHDIYGEMDLFYVFGVNYTDNGGLTSFDQIELHPKRREAEYFEAQSGVMVIPNTNPLEGASEAIRVDHNGHIMFEGRNLLNITGVRYLVAAASAGGSIELRVGSTTGPVLSTTNVPATGGASTWVNVESTFTDPGGKNDLYFVFKKGAGQTAIFDLNYIEFIGAGISTDNSPPEVVEVSSSSMTEVVVEFNEILNQVTAEQVSNYTIDNGVTVTSATLQLDNRTVILATSMLTSGTTYGLTVSNVTNSANLAMVTSNHPFSLFELLRINTGGPQVVASGGTFIADQFSSGGSPFTNAVPIAGTTDDELYQTERFGTFSYNIPVPAPGEYDIRLHFAEIFFGLPGGGSSGGVGSRIFNVTIEGVPVLTNFDILSEVSPATALQKELDNITINDGVANIGFIAVAQSPKISAIEILPPNTFTGNSDASITITSPSQGWDVNQPFDVAFSIENWTILEGDTHIHYYIDDIMQGPYYSYDPITIDNLSLGNHTIKVELFLANHTGTGVFDEVTVNVTGQISCNTTPFPDQWGVKQLETSSLPYRSVYTFADFDLDGDGLKDIVTGGWWYKNPGSIAGNWVRSDIGGTFKNVAFVHDFDGDGDMDLLGTTGEYTGVQLVWAQNNGAGNFTVFTNIPAGDSTYSEPFLAGIAGGEFSLGGPYQMAINWNGAEQTGSPIEMLTVPNDPTVGTWPLVAIAGAVSSGEDIQVGDIDQDNDLDLFQGINWLRNNGDGTWTTFDTGITYVTTPDRARLADFDRDGDLDAVVGQLSLGAGTNPARNEFAWFAAPADPTQPWVRNVLDTDIEGSLSVFTTDIDFDGDQDIVVGEWRGAHRLIVFDNDLCNSGTFIKRIIDAGDPIQEHHDGARVTDIDNDGDLDIISNGWVDNFPRIYENATIMAGNDLPIVDAGGDQNVLPGSAVLNGTASDPDGGAIASYTWTQESGPSTATLSGADTADLTASDLVEGVYVFRLTVVDDEADTAFDEATITVSNQAAAIHINSGGPTYSFDGTTWSADQYFNGGTVTTNAITIGNTANDQLYQTERFSSSGTLVYEIPVSSGDHNVNLHFAEIFFGVPGAGSSGGAGSRVFNVDIENGQGALTNYDIVVAAGGSATAIVETFTDIMVTDGSLTITLTAVTNFPKISGIEVIVPGSDNAPVVFAGDDRTITIPNNSLTLDGSATDPDGGDIVSYLWTQVSGPNTATFSDDTLTDPTVSDMVEGVYIFRLTATDEENETGYDEVMITVAGEPGSLLINSGGPSFVFNGDDWTADQYFVGGSPFESVIDIANTENDQLYQTERFITSSILLYEIPVDAGTYNVDLHFAEIFYGVPGAGSSGGAGSRVFNITIENGQEQIDNYDIVVAAGGSATAVVESYKNITVNDGTLTITLTSVTEFPKISGIGVFETRPPQANAGADMTIILPENSVVLNGTGNDPDGGEVTYQWTQESGPSTATLSGADTADLTASDLVEGEYVFRLTVTDDEGETGFDEVTITVGPMAGENQAPVAVLEATPITGGAPLLVTFVGSNSTDDVGVVSYLWEFGDGTTSTEADPEKIFTTPEVYSVVLTVTDEGGLTDTATLTITVVDNPDGKIGIILESNPPNPTDGGIARILIINQPTDVNVTNITIHDVGGRYISGYTAQEAAVGDNYEIPVSNLQDGLYFVRVILSQGKSTLIKLWVRN